MQHAQIRAKFRQVYNKPNFMTPNILKFGKRGRCLWELSTDNEGYLYGVTVIEVDGTKRHDLSHSFRSQQLAEEFIGNDFQAH